MTEGLTYDVCVIGGGSSGFSAAMEASKYFTVALVDWDMYAMSDNKKGKSSH